MFNINIDEDEARALLEQAINERRWTGKRKFYDIQRISWIPKFK